MKYDPEAFAYYVPEEFGGNLLLNEPDIAWKIKDRIKDGCKLIPLYTKKENRLVPDGEMFEYREKK